MTAFRKYYNILLVPAISVILIAFLSGFTEPDKGQWIEEKLLERTRILQDCYYGAISITDAENMLREFESDQLLREDILSLRQWEDTELDIVQKMSFINIIKKKEFMEYTTYEVAIRWDMSGIPEDYILEGKYHLVVKNSRNKLFLSNFMPIN